MRNINVQTEKAVTDAPKVERAELSLRQEVRMLNILLNTMELASGSREFNGFINHIQRVINITVRAIMVFKLLVAATSPWGLLYAGASAFGLAISVINLGQ